MTSLSRQTSFVSASFLVSLASFAVGAGCGSDSETDDAGLACGDGTIEVDGECVAPPEDEGLGGSEQGIGNGDGDGDMGREVVGGQGGALSSGGAGATGGSMNASGGMMGSGGNEGLGGGTSMPCAETCVDDGNPCTEDVCDATRGHCGVPLTGNSCSDGLFCNGADFCDAGVCAEHEGEPCGQLTCNEGADRCECAQASDCPGEDLGEGLWGLPGEWSECTYAGICDQQGDVTRMNTVYACNAGSCESRMEQQLDSPVRCERGPDPTCE